MRALRSVGALLAVLALFPPAAAAEPEAPAAPTRITVGTATGERANRDLGGVSWNTGSLDGVAPLEPATVRVDASLQNLSRGPDDLDLTPLIEKVEAVRETGATPIVILSYMPAWLADHHGAFDPRDPTRVGPGDLDTWEALIADVVVGLAAASPGSVRYEVWNEPDVPLFWQDSPDAFLEMAIRTHRGVDASDSSAEIGGPAAAFPDPAFIVPYVTAVRAQGLPLDFVSWHYYGNYPFFGDDGAEFDIPIPGWNEAVFPLVARENPVTSPSVYRFQTEAVRSWVGHGPDLVIDEWNLSAGGFDDRHDTHEGAAFALATLIEMERSGLDGADFYRAANGPGDRVGDWGLVRTDGTVKPAWWALHAWKQSEGRRLAVTGDAAPDLWARATRRGGSVDVLVSAFEASGSGTDRGVVVDAGEHDCGPRAGVRLLATPDGDLAGARSVPVVNGAVSFDLPSPAVARVTFRGCS